VTSSRGCWKAKAVVGMSKKDISCVGVMQELRGVWNLSQKTLNVKTLGVNSVGEGIQVRKQNHSSFH
jgi:hypothetical protein